MNVISDTGLSPRLRGNRSDTRDATIYMGSIPAPAGEPALYGLRSCPALRVYPRACGGTHSISPFRNTRGLSLAPAGEPGSIPAPAGEPGQSATWSRQRTVYPRACGGTAIGADNYNLVGGLSPRLRGNRSTLRFGDSLIGSIPAPAGEPGSRSRASINWRVYPRACGGTKEVDRRANVYDGLSPRLRGNRVRALALLVFRSIPAPAGEPISSIPSL